MNAIEAGSGAKAPIAPPTCRSQRARTPAPLQCQRYVASRCASRTTTSRASKTAGRSAAVGGAEGDVSLDSPRAMHHASPATPEDQRGQTSEIERGESRRERTIESGQWDPNEQPRVAKSTSGMRKDHAAHAQPNGPRQICQATRDSAGGDAPMTRTTARNHFADPTLKRDWVGGVGRNLRQNRCHPQHGTVPRTQRDLYHLAGGT